MFCELEIDKVFVEVLVFVVGVLVEIVVLEGIIVDVIVKFVVIFGFGGVVVFVLVVVVVVFVLVVFKDVENVLFVNKLMVEKGIDLVNVVGFGCDGCIMKEDVLKVVIVLVVVLVVLVVVFCVLVVVEDVFCEECVKMI